LKQTTITIVVILAIIVYLANIQSNRPDSIPLPIVNNAFAQENNTTLQPSQGQTISNSSLLNTLNQTLSELENVNVTSRDRAGYNQTNGTTDNQTIQTANGTNGTSTNGTTVEILNNAFQQQPRPPLQSPFNLLPAPQSQPELQQPPTIQQEQTPFQQQPPPNLIPMPPLSSSPQFQPPLMIQPLLQQQPSTVIPPPSGPLYPIPSFPTPGPSYQSPVLLSQNSYYGSTGSMHIVGEVMNQSPVTARFVKIIATFYNSNNQVIGTESTYADPSQLAPGQRAPFEIIAFGGSVPMYQMSYYGLRVDSQQP
jgi:hypothetical protein